MTFRSSITKCIRKFSFWRLSMRRSLLAFHFFLFNILNTMNLWTCISHFSHRNHIISFCIAHDCSFNHSINEFSTTLLTTREVSIARKIDRREESYTKMLLCMSYTILISQWIVATIASSRQCNNNNLITLERIIDDNGAPMARRCENHEFRRLHYILVGRGELSIFWMPRIA